MSWIEYLVSLLIGTIILGCLTTLYIISQKNQQYQETLIALINNSRIAVQTLSSAISTAGYVGCAKLSQNFPVYSDIPFEKIKSYQDKKIKPGTDALIRMRAGIVNATLMKKMEDFNHLELTTDPVLKVGNIAIISDCESADIFKVKKSMKRGEHLQLVTTDAALSKEYPLYSNVSLLEKSEYFIAKTERLNARGEEINALYVKDINSDKTEIIEGVADMKINYTVLEQGRLKEYSTNQITNFSNVVGVSLSLELVSLDYSTMHKIINIYVALRD